MAKFLRKFGLDYCDLPSILLNVDVLLRVLTIKINIPLFIFIVKTLKNLQSIPWVFYLILIITGGCYIYVYMISAYWYVLVRYPETGDLSTAVVEMSLSMCSCTCIFKLTYMKLNTKKMMNLVEEYLNCDKLVVKNTRFAANFLQYLRVIKKRAITVWVVLFTNSAIYFIFPLFIPGRHFSEDMYIIYGLEPMFESPNYEIASAMMATGVVFAFTGVVHITLFNMVIIGYIEAQLLALSEELSNIWYDSEKFYDNYILHNTLIQKDKVRNIFLEIRLREIMNFHVMTINLRNNVENKLQFIFLVDFIVMMIAIVTELVGGLENTFFQIPFTLSLVLMDCLIGQRLIDASRMYEHAVYTCMWENFNVSNQKTILLILQCSQKTLILSAGGMAVLNFPSLMFVIRSAYSIYTTLKSAV